MDWDHGRETSNETEGKDSTDTRGFDDGYSLTKG